MTKELDKFKKHINEPIEVKLKNREGEENTFKFKPLNAEQFTKMMILGDAFENQMKEKNMVDKEVGQELISLYVDIVKTSYPKLSKDIAEQFVVSNFGKLAGVVEKLAPQDMDESKVAKIKKAKERMRKARKKKS